MSERLLRLRKQASRKRPAFNRQETWKLKRFKNNPTWRKPRGHSSKMRRKLKGNPALVSIGYRGPKAVRYFHPSGAPEHYVTNVAEMERVPEGTVARIASAVGTKKKVLIVAKAHERGIRVVNPRVKFVYVDSVEALERYAPLKDVITTFKLAKVGEEEELSIRDRADELKVPLEEGA